MSQSGQAGRFAGGGGIIQTINGDTGSITGSTVTIYADRGASPGDRNAGASVYFQNSGTVSKLFLTDALQNTFIGNAAGVVGTTSQHNTGIGVGSFSSIGSGCIYNTCIGDASGHSLTNNCTQNTLIGDGAGGELGYSQIIPNAANGNTLVGAFSGFNYGGSETFNIILGTSAGVAGESFVMRLGNSLGNATHITAIQATYIEGITGVTVSNAKLVTINSSTGQLGVTNGIVGSWTDVTSATQTLAVGNGYITDRGGGVTYTLPSTASLGDIIEIVGKAGLATITPNANQQILIGAASGSIGPGGTATATNAGDCITLRCITGGASSVWRAESYVGNWTLI